MKLHDDHGHRIVALLLTAGLAACGGGPPDTAGMAGLPAAPAASGPAADYPVVIGDSYVVAGVTYEPRDVLSYDEVGYAAIDPQGGAAMSGEHHTLPLPSYVEVTSLDSGRTILVRLERRGPMTGNFLIGLSPAAARQLGVMAGAPVRVRRVNPPEEERALLRTGQPAPARMDTPIALVNALRRRLPNGEGPLPENPAGGQEGGRIAAGNAADGSFALPPLAAAAPTSSASFPPALTRSVSGAPKPATAPSAAAGGFVVQAGAFANPANAERVARAIGGEVSRAGSLYRVRTGPFATRSEAQASLAKVRAAGYSEARILDGGG